MLPNSVTSSSNNVQTVAYFPNSPASIFFQPEKVKLFHDVLKRVCVLVKEIVHPGLSIAICTGIGQY